MDKELTGRIARERIHLFETPSLPPGVVEGFQALGDATGIVSDVLDELGIAGALGASTFRPTMPGSVVAGPALTVRNIARSDDSHEAARAKRNGMAEFEAHNLARAGDVLVIEGVPGVSNMGGISAQTGKRAGEAGAVVQGGIRDLGHSRGVGYPLWATEVSPVTGKWRIETVEINGAVTIGGITVRAGDLVLADDTGICFVPRDRAEEVLALCRQRARDEADRCARLDAGEPLPQLLRATIAA